MTSKIDVWLYIALAVVIALGANYISTVWAAQDNKFGPWFLLLLIVSPLVFITFGLVTAKVGLAVTSGTVDALLTVSTMLVGLFVLHESASISTFQYFGIGLAFVGILFMQFGK